jgi:hypothetical protein
MTDELPGLDDAVASVLHQDNQNTAINIRNNLANSLPNNPDEAAAQQHLARAANVPVQTVQADPQAIRTQVGLSQVDANAIATQMPHVAKFLGVQANADIAHDDIPNLSQIEKTATVAPTQTPDSKSILDSVLNTPSEALKGLGGSFNKLASGVGILSSALPVVYDKLAEMSGGKPGGTTAQDWWFRTQVDPLLDRQATFEPDKNAGFAEKAANTVGGTVGAIAQIILSGGAGATPVAGEVTAGAITKQAIEHGTKAMAVPATSDALDTGRKVYAQTGDGLAAAKAAMTQYGVSTLGGVVPISMPGSLLTRLMGGAVSGAATGEVSRKLLNAEMPDQMQQPFDWEQVALSGIVGMTLAAGAGGHNDTSAFQDSIRRTYSELTKASDGAEAGQRLQALGELATASKLRERDPQAFKQFVQGVTENGPLENVYIDAKTLDNALAQSGVKPEDFQARLPEVAKQMHEATQTQGDVQIPVADYMTHIAGGPLDAALMPHLKTDPEGKTVAEAQEFYQNQAETFKNEAEKIVNQKGQQDAWQASTANVEANLLGQLKQTKRFPDDVSGQYAKLMSSFYAVQAQRLGITPEQMFTRYPLQVRADRPSLGGRVMDQPDKGKSDSARGSISFGDDIQQQPSVITLLKSADLSTFSHEAGHFYLEALSDMAKQPDAPAEISSDMNHVLNWFGVKDHATWQDMPLDDKRQYHEQFARGFESYLFEGKAPSVELQGVFSRFRSWLVNVYKSIDSLNVSLTPEVRGVFDRMLASEEAIKNAEATRGYLPLFNTAQEAGITPEVFAEYQRIGRDATAHALDELQARSLRDMQWLDNARSGKLKELQKEAASKRKEVRREVELEVNAEPINQARTWLKRGEMVDAEGNDIKAERGYKLNTDDLRSLYPESALIRPDLTQLKGMTSGEGLHPDMVADMFGFSSGDELVRNLIEGEKPQAKIEGLTDQRMLERYGELASPEDIKRAAEAAIHNEARARFMATGLKVLAKSPLPSRQIVAAAKEAAEAAIAQKRISDVRPALYEAAEARANKAAIKAVAKDPAAAIEAQRAALLNNQLARSAETAMEDVRKGVEYLKKFDKRSIRDTLQGDFIEQIDALRDQFDLRQKPSDSNRRRTSLIQWATSQREAGFEPAISDWLADFSQATPYKKLTVENFRGVVDAVKSIEHIAREQKLVTIDGQRRDLAAVVLELLAPLKERGAKFTAQELLEPPQKGVDSSISVALHRVSTWLRLIDTDLKPQEFKRNKYDMHELLGPYGKYLFDRMFDRNYWKNDQLKSVSDEFQAKAAELGSDWQKSLYDLVTNKTLLDPDLSSGRKQVFMKITRGKMLGIARHVGNESNFAKLTQGMNWQPEIVWQFLHDNMTEKDWKATQAQWDIFEKYWGESEALIHRLGGVPPRKIPPRSFGTKYGQMKGGYSPIDYDPIRSKLSARFGELSLDPNERVTDPNTNYKATTTFNGSMVNRSEGYTDRINLDFHAVEGRLRDTIHDLAYREALMDANKILKHPEFKSQFTQTFGREEYAGLQKWLLGIKGMQAGEDDIRGFEKALQYARQGVVMTGIAYRLSTVAVHGGSAALKSLGYLGDGAGAKYFAARVARMGTGNASADISEAAAKFPEIRTRLLQMDRDYKSGSRSLYEAEDWRAKNDRFGHAMVAWSDALTAVPTAWAAYDRATSEGVPMDQGGTGAPMNDKDAIHYANKVVREAHGTALETNRSLFMQSRGVKGLFGTIYGFMNNTYGQMGDMLDKAVEGGHFNNHPALAARALATLIVPALWAAYIKHGSPDDAGESAWKWAVKAITGEVASTVPFVRDAWAMIEYGTRGSSGTVAPIRIIGDTVAAATDAWHETQGKSTKIIQDTANALGELLHVGGLGQAGKTAQYLREVQEGKQHPQNAAQFAHDAALGPKHAH